MGPQVIEVLHRTISEILEGAAFLFTERIDPAGIPDPAGWKAIGVALSFTGPRHGTFHLWAEERFARIAAANMLGVDETDEESKIKQVEALKELLNIIVGRFLTEAFGEELLFDLGLPMVLDPSQLAGEAAGPQTYWYNAEGTPLLVTLVIEP